MSLEVVLAIIAAVLAVIALIQSRGRDLLAWALLLIAAADILPRLT